MSKTATDVIRLMYVHREPYSSIYRAESVLVIRERQRRHVPPEYLIERRGGAREWVDTSRVVRPDEVECCIAEIETERAVYQAQAEEQYRAKLEEIKKPGYRPYGFRGATFTVWNEETQSYMTPVEITMEDAQP